MSWGAFFWNGFFNSRSCENCAETVAARRVSIYSQFMIRPTCLLLATFLIAGIFAPCGVAGAQASAPAQATAPASAPTSKSAAGVDYAVSAAQGIGFAEKGRCREALPLLKKAIPHLTDKQLKFEAAMASARCAMSLDQVQTTVDTLLLLNREYPHNPEVLYVTIHYFSELANRSEQDLVSSAPGSYQAHKLDAEGLESQEKWDGRRRSIGRFWRRIRNCRKFITGWGGFCFRSNRRRWKKRRSSLMRSWRSIRTMRRRNLCWEILRGRRSSGTR